MKVFFWLRAGSGVQHLACKCKALSLIPSTRENKFAFSLTTAELDKKPKIEKLPQYLETKYYEIIHIPKIKSKGKLQSIFH